MALEVTADVMHEQEEIPARAFILLTWQQSECTSLP